jgi:hypothetical protein
VNSQLSESEYEALSNQKADDWRSISEVNPTLFGVAGAIFAAGVAQKQPAVVALSPLPLYLGVWHMVRHARLQLQMITYLATFPPESRSWERDIAEVRPRFWDRTRGRGPQWFGELMRPSAWNTWLVITIIVSAVAIAIPPVADYPDACLAFWVGIPVSVVATTIVVRQAAKVQSDREIWTELWKQYLSEQT